VAPPIGLLLLQLAGPSALDGISSMTHKDRELPGVRAVAKMKLSARLGGIGQTLNVDIANAEFVTKLCRT
jgi:hypothetical protein